MKISENSEPIFDLADMTLFGAEAAEAESNQAVFNSYFYETSQFKDFADPSRPFQIANAYKGEGKSSFLRAVEQRVKDTKIGFVVRISSADLDVEDRAENADAWMRTWKGALSTAIAIEIGKSIKVAWAADDIKAVEEAEKIGARERNVIGLILERFSIKTKAAGVEVEHKASTGSISERTIERLLDKSTVWLLVDESDVNFTNTRKLLTNPVHLVVL